MIYQLTGTVILTSPSFIVVDCGGVGYKLTASGHTVGAASEKKGKTMTVLTEMSVREDAVELFGFADEEERSAFKMLISVSGVGPKAAMAILTALSPEKFALAVTTEDTKAISKAQGVGAKLAARIVLELKDKISKEISASDVISSADDQSVGGDRLSDSLNTLIVLGYTRSEAMNALKGVDPALSVEDTVRAALKKLAGGLK